MNSPHTQKKGVSISEQNVLHVLLVCLNLLWPVGHKCPTGNERVNWKFIYQNMYLMLKWHTAFNCKFWHWDYHPIASHDYWNGLNLLSNCFYKSQPLPCIQKYENTIQCMTEKLQDSFQYNNNMKATYQAILGQHS